MSDDKIRKVLELVDKSSNIIPEGDYLEICNLLRDIRVDISSGSVRREDETIMMHEMMLMNRDLLNAMYRQNNVLTSSTLRQRADRAQEDMYALIRMYRQGNLNT